jgi:hypothetical protein
MSVQWDACIEPQDQPGNCPECGMKLLEMQTKQTSRRLGRQYAEYADLTQTNADIVNNYSAKSASSSAKSAYLYFVEGHISIMALLFQKYLQVLLECQDLKLKNGKFIQSKMVKIKEYLWKFNF